MRRLSTSLLHASAILASTLLFFWADPALAQAPVDFNETASALDQVLPTLLRVAQMLAVAVTIIFAFVAFFKGAKGGQPKGWLEGLLLVILAGFVLAPVTYLDLFGMHGVAEQVSIWLGEHGAYNVGGSHYTAQGTGGASGGSTAHTAPDGTRYWGSVEDGVIVFHGPRERLVTCKGTASSDQAMVDGCRSQAQSQTTESSVPEEVYYSEPGVTSSGQRLRTREANARQTSDGSRYWGSAEDGVVVFRGPRERLVTCQGLASSDQAMVDGCREAAQAETTESSVPDEVSYIEPGVTRSGRRLQTNANNARQASDGTRYWGSAEDGVVVFRGPREELVSCRGEAPDDDELLARCHDHLDEVAVGRDVPSEITLPGTPVRARTSTDGVNVVTIQAPSGAPVICSGAIEPETLERACQARLDRMIEAGDSIPERIEVRRRS